MKKLIYGSLMGMFVFALSATFVDAHGGPYSNDVNDVVEPGSKACMGQLARMHAQDETKGTNGIPASIAKSRHGSFHDYGKNATVQQTMKAFKDYCEVDVQDEE